MATSSDSTVRAILTERPRFVSVETTVSTGERVRWIASFGENVTDSQALSAILCSVNPGDEYGVTFSYDGRGLVRSGKALGTVHTMGEVIEHDTLTDEHMLDQTGSYFTGASIRL